MLRQLGDVGGDAPGLIPSRQMRSRASPRFVLEVGVGECLPVSVADEATWPPRAAPAHPRNRHRPAPAGWRRCDKDAARPTDTSGVLLILGLEAPACLRDSLAPAVIDIAVGAGRAASSTDQGGGKRRGVTPLLFRRRRLGNGHNEPDFQCATLAHIYPSPIAVDLYRAILALTSDVIFTPH